MLAVLMQNNFDPTDNRGSIQFDWSFPMLDPLRGYVQYFNGYGKTLIDYNASNNRIAIGVMGTDWL